MLYQLASIFGLAILPQALAHGGVLSIEIGKTWYWGWQPYDTPVGQSAIIRPWSTYNPITDPTDPTLSCNDNGTAGALQLTAPITAGSEITAYWNNPWPHPYGPMLVYLAQCPGSSCTTADSSTLQWFKIDESGLINGTVYDGYWGDGKMIAQNSSWTTTIPATVPSGNYLIRFETIALHSLPAQFYPECAQLSITGGGSLAPTAAELVTFPGAYSSTDPGLIVDIYSNTAQTQTNYTIPGPPLYGSSGSASPTGVSIASSATPSAPSKSATSASSPATSVSKSASSVASAPTASGTASTATAAHYAQCGGTGWTGATVCAAPYTCTYSNAYYSQCL